MLEGSSSNFVARVRMQDGQEALLKDADERELAVLRAWHDSGVTPQVLSVLEGGLCLRQWARGLEVGSLPDGGSALAERVGAALRLLHVAPDEGTSSLPSIMAWLASQEGYLHEAEHLAPLEREAAVRTLGALLSDPGEEVLVHGDAYYRNVLFDEDADRISVIDPRGFLGPGAFDLACYACMSPSASPLGVLGGLARGYGGEPPHTRDIMLILTLRSIERFRGDHGLAGQEAGWRRLAASLMEASC